MNVGFVTSPLSGGHAGRGVGFYTKHLSEHLIKSVKSPDKITLMDSPGGLSEVNLLHYPFFDLFFPTLPAWQKIPFIVTIHDAIPLEYPQHFPPGIKGSLNLIRQRLALSQAAAVITDSYASVAAIRKYLGVPHEKIKLIYLAPASHFHKISDQKLLKKIAAKYRLPERFVLYVGDVNWNKNLYGLLAAVKQLDRPLVLVGKQSAVLDSLDLLHPELAHLRPIIDLINRPDSGIYRLGYVPDSDLVGIYNLASVYCQPSFAEGFGLPVLEAMACGTPVACSRTHSLPEIAGNAAVYFDPYNIESIAWSINRLLSEVKLANHYSDQGILRAKRYSWEYTAHSTLSVYKEVLSK